MVESQVAVALLDGLVASVLDNTDTTVELGASVLDGIETMVELDAEARGSNRSHMQSPLWIETVVTEIDGPGP